MNRETAVKRIEKRNKIINTYGVGLIKIGVGNYAKSAIKPLLIDGKEVFVINRDGYTKAMGEANLEKLGEVNDVIDVFEDLGYSVSKGRINNVFDTQCVSIYTYEECRGKVPNNKIEDITDELSKYLIKFIKGTIEREFKDEVLRENGYGHWVDERKQQEEINSN